MREVFKPNGVWNVTTEGDCEGRTTKQLGVHVGHITDIAYYLRGESYYSLHFEKQNLVPAVNQIPKTTEVHVTIKAEKGYYNTNDVKKVIGKDRDYLIKSTGFIKKFTA